jgi:glutathione peroxidase-family protein
MKKASACFLLVSLVIACVSCDSDEPQATPPATARADIEVETSAPAKPLYAFELNDIDGNPVKLGKYDGKALLLVNVASKCGYTKQYAGLQALHEKYQDKGLVVLGFPANNFGSQEPGTNEEIKAFCSMTFSVTFPMFAKISVKGDDIHPLYAFLTGAETDPDFAGEIKWNFNKFLVNRAGDIVGRYDSNIEPMGEALVADVEKVLEETAS